MKNGVPTCRTGAEEKKEVMSRKLNVQNLVLAAALTLSAGAALVTSPAYADKDAKCDAMKDAKGKAACTKSGAATVGDFMKKAVGAAKKNGKKHECADCHKDQKTFELKDGADGKLATLLTDAGM